MQCRHKPKFFDVWKKSTGRQDQITNPLTFIKSNLVSSITKLDLLHSKSTYFYQWDNSNNKKQNLGLSTLSILALLAGIGIMINPALSRETFAADVTTGGAVSGSGDSDTTPSISIKLGDGNVTSLSTDVIAGTTKTVSTTLGVIYKNIDKYWIAINTENGHDGRLVGTKYPGFQIDGVGANISTGNFTDNTWGYALDGNYYNTVPEFGKPMVANAYNVPNSSIEATKNHTLSFAAKLGSDAPTDHYSTNVYISITINADNVTGISNIDTMQEMTAKICNDSKENETKQLEDTRDRSSGAINTGTKYWVTKLRDAENLNGRCWMTQNLRITNTTLTPADSNVASNFVIPASDSSGWTGSDRDTAKTYYNNNVSYGAYYNHFTATAGASHGTTSGTMTTSICPRGWILPPDTGSGSYVALVTAYGIGNNSDGSKALRDAPFRFQYGGHIEDNSLSYTGSIGNYWTATKADQSAAYYLNFSGSKADPLSTQLRRPYLGMSVRCVNDPNA